ncbi:uncharacterized protein HMPREF1541_02006 [Cyphellophora europaea CBS 101466]|uniref:Vacuolar protein 14 C-terminal Fig4-binding domain-containing protein n=1 Tax=Cyphellophora europaea (strain CBS 101466) TaxID=1220924 RepID=W2S467_CYPE1|nr:uncharacterized protein HMPREF1541_02006 [Cyphellophora europaea CBS 101466]ETN42848.1 hypothetical protein HMPREF1541_02006 [Cyphellophora europaea CBS 101466]
MEQSVQRLLTDKLYDKRKQGALELERLVREASAAKDYDKISKVVDQLCHDFAYAVHQPHARNGGLIGLAAASIALGADAVAPFLSEIVPPVLACFTDQDARVRYYACEAMYNIAKVAKGEILRFFNDIFDALCKLSADTELSVKNGAELLDRLVKDIVSESAASYVSVLDYKEKAAPDDHSDQSSAELPTAFSLDKFIPVLEERLFTNNPFTRTFLVSWLSLLDTIPDLELVSYLPSFLGGIFTFLGDSNRDVYVATHGLLDKFLTEIKKIAKIKRDIAESRRSRAGRPRRTESQAESATLADSASNDNAIEDFDSASPDEQDTDGDWIPGQDVLVEHTQILDILLKFINVSSTKAEDPDFKGPEGLSKEKEEDIGVVALRWIDSFFEVSPEDILQFVPRLVSQVLPALSARADSVRTTASRVNRSLMDYIVTLQDDPSIPEGESRKGHADQQGGESEAPSEFNKPLPEVPAAARSIQTPSPSPAADLDYAAAVNALTLQFLNEHEETRVAALGWLIMLHRKAPKKVLAFNDGTFPALLKTLSDPADAVVIRDLQLLSQISINSDDGYFSSFMVALLQLFSTDRKLLEIRGNLIIRQLCINLQPERIYRTLADCIEKDEDIEFASIMVQNLNNNLITAPELAELRKRLRNPESRDGQAFFVALFRAWCYNAVATFSLCLLAQAYEQAYNLLQIFADLEMTVNMLIQIDKLVQLLESPVFTYRYPYLYKCLYGLLMLLPQSSAFAALKNRLNSVSAIGLLHTPVGMPSSGPRPSYVHPMPSSSQFASSTGVVGAAAPPMPSPPLSSASHSGFQFGGAHTHSRARSTDKPLPLTALGSLTFSSSSPSVVAASNLGGSSSNPNATGRLGRSSRDAGAGSGGASAETVRWPELLEKFRGTQEKARWRSERAMRGEVVGGGLDALGGGPATRSLLALDLDGREGRTSAGAGGVDSASGGARSLGPGRPGSGLGRPIGSSMGPPGLRVPNNGMAGGGGGVGSSGSGAGVGGGAGGGLAGDTYKGHKSRQSLVGKFTSGIARSTGSRERDKGKEKK